MQTVVLIFVVEPKHLANGCTVCTQPSFPLQLLLLANIFIMLNKNMTVCLIKAHQVLLPGLFALLVLLLCSV